MELTQAERNAIGTLEAKQNTIRTDVLQLVEGWCTGCFIAGPGGIGKSFAVEQELKRLNADYVLLNSSITVRGLYDAMRDNPNSILWLEDAEQCLSDRKIWGLLRSACWSQDKSPHSKRHVTWITGRRTDDDMAEPPVVFTGGILVLSNADLEDTPEVQAIKTRIRCSKLNATREEMLAFFKMRCIGGEKFGEHEMSTAECWEVAEFIINIREGKSVKPLSLRDLTTGFQCYLFARSPKGKAEGVDWRERIESNLTETPRVFLSRDQQTKSESAIAVDIAGIKGLKMPERIKLWSERTGKNQAAYYRAIKRAAKGK